MKRGFDYIKLNLEDLPSDKFVILLKPKIQKKLIDEALDEIAKQTKDWGKYKQLSIYLYKKCKSFKNIKPSSIWDHYIFNWQNYKQYIPIDCIKELYKLTNKKLKEEDILFVKYKLSQNKYGINFPFIYDKNLAFLGEAIRVEGHIKKNFHQINIGNKNLLFLKKVKKIIKGYVPNNSIYENISVEVDIPYNKKVIKVKSNKREFNFYIHKASRSNKLKLNFYDKPPNLNKQYTILFSDNSKIYVKLKEIDGELVTKSNYKIASATLNLTISNITFTKIINLLLKIPAGKKSDIIFIPDILKISPLNVKVEAINAILDSECWVSKPVEKRVGIGMNSKRYLIELREIFNQLGIKAYNRASNNYIYITGIEDLKKLAKLFTFTSKKKSQRLIKILNSYKNKKTNINYDLKNPNNYIQNTPISSHLS